MPYSYQNGKEFLVASACLVLVKKPLPDEEGSTPVHPGKGLGCQASPVRSALAAKQIDTSLTSHAAAPVFAPRIMGRNSYYLRIPLVVKLLLLRLMGLLLRFSGLDKR
jgi:hypothetical protein